MDLNLDGKTALVTAASGGIGKGVAEALAEAGVRVAISGRTRSSLEKVAETLASQVPPGHRGRRCRHQGRPGPDRRRGCGRPGELVAHPCLRSWRATAHGQYDRAGPHQQVRRSQKLHPTEQSRADYIRQNIPAGYFGEPPRIGHLVAFLASPLARYINGAAIPVDGGAVRRVGMIIDNSCHAGRMIDRRGLLETRVVAGTVLRRSRSRHRCAEFSLACGSGEFRLPG